MIYVFDTNSLSNILNFYYPSTFPSFWIEFYRMIETGRIISVREVKYELQGRFGTKSKEIKVLIERNKAFFENPSNEELKFIAEIYSINHFQQNLDRKKRLEGGYFADPFIIAKAKLNMGIVVSEESYQKNGARIPNICKHFGVKCIKLKGFFEEEKWEF